MSHDTNIESILECPKCHKSYGDCEHKFPHVHGILWLFRSTESTLVQWQARVTKLLQMFLLQKNHLESELLKVDLLAPTKKRLQTLKTAIAENQEILHELLSDLWPQGAEMNTPTLAQALEEKVAAQQTIESYFNNVFRDWAWENGENEKSIKAILNVLPKKFKPKMLVVLGAGSGRLTYDLQREIESAQTLAVDINPFLLFLFKDILSGKSHSLWEIPPAPVTVVNTAQKQNLKIDVNKSVAKNIEFLFADASNLPLKAKSADAILTPWFIDIIKQDFRQLTRRINRTLSLGGSWINFGPLGFRSFLTSQNYSLEEIETILGEEGFVLETKEISEIPYLCSPLNGQQRNEKVVTFLATKKKDSKEPAAFSSLPEWIMDPTKPIRPNREVKYEIARHHLGFQILSCIDGKNSLEVIAGLVQKHYSLSAEQAKEVVTGFLIENFEY